MTTGRMPCCGQRQISREIFVSNSILALCLIPFIAAYSDLLIRDCDLRIRIIASFLKKETDSDYARYELYIATDPEIQGARWTRFSHLSIKEASYSICMLVFGIGVTNFIISNGCSVLVSVSLSASSLIGAVAIFKIHKDFKKIKSPLD